MLASAMTAIVPVPNTAFFPPEGNLGQLYARDGWKFHRELVEKYGGAVRINGLFGVKCFIFRALNGRV